VPERMRIILCGTPYFADPTFRHLLSEPDFEIIGAVTQPDRPKGRGLEVSYSFVKQFAREKNIPLHQPEKIGAPEVQEMLQRLAPDAIIIIAYGQIIPARLLPIPRLGWINLHASLLPKYRGAAPINWAVANGETKTGLTTMRIDAGMDTGDILLQREMEILPAVTAEELTVCLAMAGPPLMIETLRGLARGTITPRPQNHSLATYAPMLKKEDGRIDWSLSAQEIYNRMRAFIPWPGTFSIFRGQTCRFRAELAPNRTTAAAPGAIFLENGEMHVACGHATVLRLLAVKLEGRKQVSAAEFVNGARLKPDECFGGS